ncbi:hypothetical protein PMIN03_007070 [Paraphaeosphaeria minitans]
MKWLEKLEYKPVASGSSRDSTSESDEYETKGFISGVHTKDQRQFLISRRALILVSIINLSALLISISFFGTWFYSHYLVRNAALRRVSGYNPIYDKYAVDFEDTTINGTFFPPKEGGSIMRHQPNPADDKIWEEWELTRVYPVTREELTKMGKDYTTVAKLEDKDWGLGDNAYAAIFDVYHQLHCLNSLRKVVYGGYYNMSQARADKVMQRELHMNHCFDILLQSIQCSGNLDMIPLVWMYTQAYPFADMSINKKCHNFDKFTDWRRENSIDMDKYVEVMKQPEGDKPGIKQLPAADKYYEYWGYDNPNHKPVSEGGLGLPLEQDSNL